MGLIKDIKNSLSQVGNSGTGDIHKSLLNPDFQQALFHEAGAHPNGTGIIKAFDNFLGAFNKGLSDAGNNLSQGLSDAGNDLYQGAEGLATNVNQGLRDAGNNLSQGLDNFEDSLGSVSKLAKGTALPRRESNQ